MFLVCVCVQKSNFYLGFMRAWKFSLVSPVGWRRSQSSRKVILIPFPSFHICCASLRWKTRSRIHFPPRPFELNIRFPVVLRSTGLAMAVIYAQLSQIRCLIFISRVRPVMDYCCSLSRASASEEIDALRINAGAQRAYFTFSTIVSPPEKLRPMFSVGSEEQISLVLWGNVRCIHCDIIYHFCASKHVLLRALNSTVLALKCVFNQQLIGTETKLIPAFGFGTLSQLTVVISLRKKKETFIVHKNAVPSRKTAN